MKKEKLSTCGRFLKWRQFEIKNHLLIVLFLFIATPVFAVDLFFEAKMNKVKVGEQFEVKLFINTPGESVNAFEGKIIFSNDLIKVKEILDGNSMINFWIDKPKVQNGAVVFSGITPGGFQGNNGLFFSIIFEAKSEGVVNFGISDAKVLRNDGAGSEAVLVIMPFKMIIFPEVSATISEVIKVKDTEPPESFVPKVAKDETIFGGSWFVVFATQDKGYGVDHYEVKEMRQGIFGIFSKWIFAESPYVLRDQDLRSFIFIKAVDKAGNIRVEKISPQNLSQWYENYENWVIIVVGLIVFCIIKRFLWKRYLKK